LTVKTLASRAAMSVRNFTGVFQREMGMTPADFVETARVDRNSCLTRPRVRPAQHAPELVIVSRVDLAAS
jgi:AraC-like DNA-binding protein